MLKEDAAQYSKCCTEDSIKFIDSASIFRFELIAVLHFKVVLNQFQSRILIFLIQMLKLQKYRCNVNHITVRSNHLSMSKYVSEKSHPLLKYVFIFYSLIMMPVPS